MDLIKTLSFIKNEFNLFSDLPESMKNKISKEELINYLTEKQPEEQSEIDTFVSIIFDEVIYFLLIYHRTKKTEKILQLIIFWRNIKIC